MHMFLSDILNRYNSDNIDINKLSAKNDGTEQFMEPLIRITVTQVLIW